MNENYQINTAPSISVFSFDNGMRTVSFQTFSKK